MSYYLCNSVDGYPVHDGDMIWMLVRGNSIYEKEATYLNPQEYSRTQTTARGSMDLFNNRIFKHRQALLDYYASNNPTLYQKICNAINELI